MTNRLTSMLIFITTIFSAVNFAQAPVITIEPVDKYVIEGQTADFFIQALGDSLTYQWYKNDTLIVGATDSAYTTPATVFTDNLSEYHCIVSDSSASGVDTSAKATLYVTASGSRVTTGMQLLYKFNEGSGLTLNDSSGVGAPHNLGINNKQSITWTTDGLGVNDISYITGSTSPTKLIDACVLTDEVTIELWIEPISVNYDGWAKIITLSSDADSFANFTVYQNPNKGYEFLARTTNTDSDGRPALLTPNNTVQKQLTHLVCIRYTNGARKIYINGTEVASGAKSGRFDNWNPASRIQLANQTGDPRAWLGVYHLAAVYGRALNQSEVTANYNVGVARNDKPKFIVEPQDQGAVVGQTIKFQVRSTNTLTSYQWRKNGVDIGGATNDAYITPPLTLSDNNALYSCIVTNPFGSDTSREAKIRVTALNTRVTANRLAYYNFQEGSGNIVNDVLGYLPVNLRIDGATSNYQWKPYGLIVDSASIIKSPGQTTKWYNDVAVGTGEFTFEAWVKPANSTQLSANILSIGHTSDPSRINFAMKQNGGVLQSWLRTNTTPNNGVLMESPANSVGDSLIHITFTHGSNGKSQIFINGVMVKEDYFVGDLDTWRPDYFLRIGEQYLATSPWRGLFNLVSFYTRVLNPTEILQNYTVGPINVNLIAPANLTAQATQPGKVQLAWADNSTNEDGFIIERKQGVQNFAAIDSVGLNVSAFTDSTVADTTNYTYRVIAYTLVRKASSNTASVTTLPSSVAAPTNLTASLSPTLVNRALLSWQDNSTNELGFVVERKTGDSASVDPFTVLATLAANQTSFVDSTLADTTTYTFRVKAFDAFLSSNYSNMASVTTVLSTLDSPANLAAILSSTIINRAQLSWQDKSSNELGFIIERKTGDSASVNPFAIIDSVEANVTSFEDAALADTTTYTYRVNAFNQYMFSGYSNLASVTTVLSTIAAPSNLMAFSSPADSHDVKLMWNDNSTNEFGFVVERKTGDSLSVDPFSVIKLTAADVTVYEDTSALGSTTYTYRVKAYDFLIGSSNYSNLASVTTIPPAVEPPSNLTANLSSTKLNHVDLTWQDNSSDELGFILERKTGDAGSAEPYSVLATLAAGAASYEDSTLSDTATYTYRVKAFNSITQSVYSNLASVSTILSSVASPTNLAANLSSTKLNYVQLSWQDNSSNEFGFILERKTGDAGNAEPYLVLDTLAAGAVSYEDSGLSDTTTYTYRVKAFNSFVQSDYSNLASVSTILSSVASPTNLEANLSSTNFNHVLLTWQDNSSNELGFILERKTGDAGSAVPYSVLDTLAAGAVSYEDSTLSDNITYTYRVKAFNSFVQSGYSNLVSITTMISAIAPENGLKIPKDYALDQNYPNPFNPSTTIRFALPINAKVVIKVYNMLGQEVVNVLNSDLDAGIHETIFNASNLSSGVYFYMIKVQGVNGSNFTSTKRMILMK